MADLQADLNLVRDAFQRFDLLDGRVRFLQGPVDTTLAEFADRTRRARSGWARASAPRRRACSRRCTRRSSVGGFVIVDDHADPACARAVEEFRTITASPSRSKPSTRRPSRGARPTRSDAQPGGWLPGRDRVAWACRWRRPRRVDAIDLTVVVVFYNMRREAARTLRSLSRAYQLGLEDVGYEVIAVENGSHPDQKLERRSSSRASVPSSGTSTWATTLGRRRRTR